jgi:hypothetical protein
VIEPEWFWFAIVQAGAWHTAQGLRSLSLDPSRKAWQRDSPQDAEHRTTATTTNAEDIAIASEPVGVLSMIEAHASSRDMQLTVDTPKADAPQQRTTQRAIAVMTRSV